MAQVLDKFPFNPLVAVKTNLDETRLSRLVKEEEKRSSYLPTAILRHHGSGEISRDSVCSIFDAPPFSSHQYWQRIETCPEEKDKLLEYVFQMVLFKQKYHNEISCTDPETFFESFLNILPESLLDTLKTDKPLEDHPALNNNFLDVLFKFYFDCALQRRLDQCLLPFDFSSKQGWTDEMFFNALQSHFNLIIKEAWAHLLAKKQNKEYEYLRCAPFYRQCAEDNVLGALVSDLNSRNLLNVVSVTWAPSVRQHNKKDPKFLKLCPVCSVNWPNNLEAIFGKNVKIDAAFNCFE